MKEIYSFCEHPSKIRSRIKKLVHSKQGWKCDTPIKLFELDDGYMVSATLYREVIVPVVEHVTL